MKAELGWNKRKGINPMLFYIRRYFAMGVKAERSKLNFAVFDDDDEDACDDQ